MRSSITATCLAVILLLMGSAIFAVCQLHPRAALIPSPEAVPSSFFGMTLHNYNTTTPWPSIPFASLRSWDTAVNWADIQQAPNSYIWSNLDALIDLAQSRGVDLVFTLGRTPRWASANPDAKSPYGAGRCAPPANIQYWDEFLETVVNHAAGKIRFWETWNEPQNPDFYCGDIATMVELQEHAYRIIKRFDPGATVLTPSPVNALGPQWMSRFLAGGGSKYADVMAFHGYLAPREDAEAIIPVIASYKSVFTQYGQAAKPVWDTEAGWGQNSWLPDPDLQAAFLAKFYVLHWSAGVDRLYWYAYDNKMWGTLWKAQSGLNKAGVAYREVRRWLQGATMTTPCAITGAIWTCDLARENGYRARILWTTPIASPPIAAVMPDFFKQYRDLEGTLRNITAGGIQISNKPVLVETGAAL
jgi:polysaccharide biosynthesis protein PslG